MHILLLIGSIPLNVFISMENSDAILFKLCTEYCKSSSELAKRTWSSARENYIIQKKTSNTSGNGAEQTLVYAR
jgi:hypothetical protein